MNIAALTFAVIAAVVAALALWIATQAHNHAIDAARQLARHRHSHAERATEQPAARHSPMPGPPPAVSDSGPPTEAMPAIDPDTLARPAVRLPPPGRIGAQVPAVDE